LSVCLEHRLKYRTETFRTCTEWWKGLWYVASWYTFQQENRLHLQMTLVRRESAAKTVGWPVSDSLYLEGAERILIREEHRPAVSHRAAGEQLARNCTGCHHEVSPRLIWPP
jgi:hypothetical protein